MMPPQSSEVFVLTRRVRILLAAALFAAYLPVVLPHLLLADLVFRRSHCAEPRHLPPGPFGLSFGVGHALAGLGVGLVVYGFWRLLLKLHTVVISDQGVTIYTLWMLRWGDVASARVRSVAGRKYIYVSRDGKFFRWWIPLTFVGARSLIVALRERAPIGNPIRDCLDGVVQRPVRLAEGSPR